MKTEIQIKQELYENQHKLIILKAQHDQLHQIDMLSADGSNLREQINKHKGKIEVLEWILKDEK